MNDRTVIHDARGPAGVRSADLMSVRGFAESGGFFWLFVAFTIGVTICTQKDAETPGKGDLSKSGGSPTIRKSFVPLEDDPYTSNDESNDQPLGHFGTMTLAVHSYESGNYYSLDGEVYGFTLERLYFPKGGWIDFYDCELEEDLTGLCWDEEGRSWSIEGESYGSLSLDSPEATGEDDELYLDHLFAEDEEDPFLEGLDDF